MNNNRSLRCLYEVLMKTILYYLNEKSLIISVCFTFDVSLLPLYCRYGEYKDYDFSRGGWQKGTGHFTQVVWKSTKELGIGRAKTADGKLTFVVGRYRPAGNIINYMADNIFDLSHKA